MASVLRVAPSSVSAAVEVLLPGEPPGSSCIGAPPWRMVLGDAAGRHGLVYLMRLRSSATAMAS